jgi:hypothetical protein
MERAPRFLATPDALVDRESGLEWEPGASHDPVSWAEAASSAAAAGRRLPTVVELMSFLMDLATFGGPCPRAGLVVWSASGSPWAPASKVRAVCCDAERQFVVVLRERGEPAHRWAVRARRT